MTRALILTVLLTSLPSLACGGDPASLRIEWKDRFLTVSGDAIPGGSIVTHYLEAYCRPGSTDREWKQTVLPHASRLVSANEEGTLIRLEDKLSDGVVVVHTIESDSDSVTFTVVAKNPTRLHSEAHWAQPCMRVDKFTGTDKSDARKVFPPYVEKCFILLDGELTRLPTQPWGRQARYVPGQVYVPNGVDRNDVNPRPLSSLVPSCGLTGCFSGDESMILAVAWEPYQEIFQGVITCMHSDFRIGGLKPGESKTIRGKIYVVPSDSTALIERFERDFGRVR